MRIKLLTLVALGLFVGGIIIAVIAQAVIGHEYNIGFQIGVGMGGVAFFYFIIKAIKGIWRLIGKISGDSSSSSGSSTYNYMQSRQNDPHTCGNCTKYSSAKGECRLNGDSKSPNETCVNWC
jgi:hypothetical protein